MKILSKNIFCIFLCGVDKEIFFSESVVADKITLNLFIFFIYIYLFSLYKQ